MSSVLIFIKTDNDHDNPAQDWQKFKAGDVIDIQSKDKFQWGAAVQGPKALGWWRVVVVPNSSAADLSHLLESGPMPYVSMEPLDPAKVKHQKRLHAVDLALLKETMTRDEFLAAVVRKPELVHSKVIG